MSQMVKFKLLSKNERSLEEVLKEVDYKKKVR